MSLSEKDAAALDNALDNAELYAKAPNSSENRRLVYGAYHGCLSRAKKREAQGNIETAELCREMAAVIKKTTMEMNPFLKDKNFN